MQERRTKFLAMFGAMSALLLTVGTLGGVLLGDYATANGAAQKSTDYVAADFVENSATPYASSPTATMEDGPENYTCRGCGPSLAERQAQAYASYVVDEPYVHDDGATIAPYRPVPFAQGDDPPLGEHDMQRY